MRSVPNRLPSTVFPLADWPEAALISRPVPVLSVLGRPTTSDPFAEMTLPSPGFVPPTALFDALLTAIPVSELRRGTVPVASSPTMLACTRFAIAPAPEIITPVGLPEMTLPAPATPIRLPGDAISTPPPALPRRADPSGDVPM